MQSFKLKLETVVEPVLHNINLHLKPGDFLTVVGKVGAGKTSLLYSIMEETCLLKGERVVHGSLAYVEQEPFIYSATVQENILFGKELDKEKFERAVKAA